MSDIILDGHPHRENTDILGITISYAGFSCGCYTIGTDTTAIFIACKEHFHRYHRGLIPSLMAHNKQGELTPEDKAMIEEAYYNQVKATYYP